MLWSQQGFLSPAMMYDSSVMWATKGKKETRNYQTRSKTMYQVLARGEAHVELIQHIKVV